MTLSKTGGLGHWVDLSKLNKDSVIVDAGACVGGFIEEIRKHVDCKIIAIEPDRKNFKILKEKNFKNVELYNKALVGKDKPKHVIFYANILNELGNIHNLHERVTRKTIINTMCLKDLPDKIDYLKLDIEGEEDAVIQDIKDNVKQLSLEVHKNNNINELKEWLEKIGFKCQLMLHSEIYASKI